MADDNPRAAMALVRCAIYTRKSTEEGLEQAFNSLEAQREAAEAYIASQKQTGWTALAERYDDGGFTGANLERPALRRLLHHVEAGQMDCVVVHRVDRLSRSLLDFARLMAQFEQHGVSFVSVTQQFNTTTSLGRLTLNILLSFAQFEREIIAERTRDKISAARRKGRWSGGIPVLGYSIDPIARRLTVNQDEAARVRAIFHLFRTMCDLTVVAAELRTRGWVTKQWTSRGGTQHGGRPFTERCLARLLGNVTYTGAVNHKGEIYDGEHEPIIETPLWREVNQLLSPQQSPKSRRGKSGLQGNRRGRSRTNSQSQPAVCVPRISRLLALAIRFEAMLKRKEVLSLADLARLGQVSRARVTQILNLLLLSPALQERILTLDGTDSSARVCERNLRKLTQVWDFDEQQRLYEGIIARGNAGRGD